MGTVCAISMTFCNYDPIVVNMAQMFWPPMGNISFYIFLGTDALANSEAWKTTHAFHPSNRNIIFLADNAKGAIRQIILLCTQSTFNFVDLLMNSHFFHETRQALQEFALPDNPHATQHATWSIARDQWNNTFWSEFRTFAEVIPPAGTIAPALWGDIAETVNFVHDAVCASNPCADDPSIAQILPARSALVIGRDEANDTPESFAFLFTMRDPMP